MNNRRTTLGVLNMNALNSRNNAPNGRLSMGVGEMKPMSRMSLGVGLGPAMNGGTAPRRVSMNPSQPSVIPRRSNSIVPRSSSISTVSRSLNDPRNVSDKHFLAASIRSLVEFLSERNYDQQISPKILTKPANKDYYNIVLFLFRQIDPNYNMSGKLEDEIVAMFRFLGYPFPVAKSHISAVGSPHAWPNMLATITWLLELLRYDEALLQEYEGGGGNGEPLSEERAFYRYLSRAYGHFINGRDVQEAALERQFVEGYENKNMLVKDQIEALDKKNASLANEIEEVKRRSALLPQLDRQRRDLQQQVALLTKQQEEKLQQQMVYKEQIEGKEREMGEVKGQTVAVNRELAVLRDKIANQEISPEDVGHMVNERQRLEQACQHASETRQALQRKVVELEMMLRDKVQTLEDTVKAYHSIAEDLKMIPQTARNSRGETLTIDIDPRAKKREGLLRSAVKTSIVPVLVDVRKEVSEMTLALREELLAEIDRQEELSQRQTELTELLDTNKTKLKRLDTSYQREKESLEKMVEEQMKAMDEAETKLALQRDGSNEDLRITFASRRLAELSSLRHARQLEFERKRQDLLEGIMEVVSSCTGHREVVSQGLEDLKLGYSHRLQSYLPSSSTMTMPRSSLPCMPPPVPAMMQHVSGRGSSIPMALPRARLQDQFNQLA